MFAGMALLLFGCAQKVSDERYVENAQEHLDNGQPRKAVIELKNALRENHNNAQARRLLGETHLLLGDAASAEKELKVAARLGVAQDSVMPSLAKALLAQGKSDELAALAVVELQSANEKAVVLAAQGLGKIVEKEPEIASKLIARASELAPNSDYVALARAGLAFAKGESEAAQKELQAVLSANPEFGAAWSLLGDVHKKLQQLSEAENAYTQAIKHRYSHNTDMINRALVRVQLADYEAAGADVATLIKRLPKHPTVNYAQALIHEHRNNLEGARDSLEASLKVNPRQIAAKYLLSTVHLRLNNVEQAERYAEQAFAEAPASVPIRNLLANLKLRSGLYIEADELVRPIVEQVDEDVVSKNILATSLLGRHEYAEAVALLERIVEMRPDAESELRLGAALMALEKPEEALVHIESALKQDPSLSQGWSLLVQYHVSQNNFVKAREVAERYIEARPKSAAPWNLMADLRKDLGDLAGVEEAYATALRLEAGDPVASHALALSALERDDFSGARGYLENVLKQHQDHAETLMQLAMLDFAENKDEAALAKLERVISVYPRAAKPRVLLARYHLLKGEADKVGPLMVELTSQKNTPPEVKEIMAHAELALNRFREARFFVSDLLEIQPDSPDLNFLMARVAAGLGDENGMEKSIYRTLQLDPEHFAARLAAVRLELLRNNQARAKEHMSELLRLDPEHPSVLRLKAAFAQMSGYRQEAAGLLEEVFEQTPSTTNMLTLARQRWNSGQLKDAVSLQEKWTTENPEDLVASLALAGAYSRIGEAKKSVQQYESLLERDENNVVALNELAWNLLKEDPAKALGYAERAVELAPESGEILDTLAMAYLGNGNLERAKRSIERALEKLPDNPSIQFHSAKIAEAVGNTGKARLVLDTLLGGSEDFPERKEAEQMYRRLTAN